MKSGRRTPAAALLVGGSLMLGILAIPSAGQEQPAPHPDVAVLPLSQQSADHGLRRETQVAFVEGPAWQDGVLFFSDIPNNRIMEWRGQGAPRVHRTPSNHANGLAFDAEGRMVVAEEDGRLVRENNDGSVEVLAERFDGAPFNSLNDLAIDSQGRIYFTDPAYKVRANAPQRDAEGAVVEGVYRLDPDGTLTRIIAHEVSVPNGILVSPGDRYLWVAENDSRQGGRRRLVRFDLRADGTIDPASKRDMFDWGSDRGADGMAVDSEGNIYAAAGLNFPLPGRTSIVYKNGVYAFTQDGRLFDFIPIPVDPASNVAFGGENFDTLYVTAGYTIWSFQLGRQGHRPFAPE